jgi:hypothetical protein
MFNSKLHPFLFILFPSVFRTFDRGIRYRQPLLLERKYKLHPLEPPALWRLRQVDHRSNKGYLIDEGKLLEERLK